MQQQFSGSDYLGSMEQNSATKFKTILNMLRAEYLELRTSRNNTWSRIQRTYEAREACTGEGEDCQTIKRNLDNQISKLTRTLNRGNEALLECKVALANLVDAVNDL
jgi:hypothetical protein